MSDNQVFVFAVGQQSFGDRGNHFCTLVPVCRLDGTPASPREEFPNRGLCWWLVRGGAELERSEPGQLVVGPVEPSLSDALDPGKDRLQLRWSDARLGGEAGTVLEVLDAGAGDDPRRLLDPRRPLELDHAPSSLVLVRLGAKTYGPFRAEAEPVREGPRPYRVRLRNTARPEVMELDAADLDAVGGLASPDPVTVSLEQQPVTRPGIASRQIKYRFLSWDRFEALKARGPKLRRVEPELDLLRRVARDHLRPREKVRQLAALLEEFEGLLEASATADAASALDMVRAKGASLRAAEDVAADLAQALIASGALKAQVEQGVEERYQAYLERHAAAAEASVAVRVAEAEKRLQELQSDGDALWAVIEAEREGKRREFDAELERGRAAANAELEARARQVEEKRASLEREQARLATALNAATARFSEGRAQVFADALALQPALRAMGLTVETAPSTGPSATTSAAVPGAADALPPARQESMGSPVWPAWSAAPPRTARERLPEAAFLDRFSEYVRAAGYRFKEADLRAFHLLAKCGDLTVLGGLSGTGKSSMVRLYAAALAGEDHAARSRLLVVDVSPSWAEPADLLGAANLLDRRYEPAPTGLFWHLAAAAREHEEHGAAAGLVSVCLDEMNLAQPEHYLAGMLQALERPGRSVAAFEPGLVREDDPARRFARLLLPPGLRLFGTVNFDETTRPLSLRLRDRAAVLELAIERHAGLAPRPGTEDAAVPGPPVTVADFQSWMPDGALAPDAAALLDQLQPLLLALGAPVTARRATAIRRMLAASAAVMAEGEALDLALATRVVPLLRNTQRAEGGETARRLRATLADWGAGHPRTTLALDRLVAAEQDAWDGLPSSP